MALAALAARAALLVSTPVGAGLTPLEPSTVAAHLNAGDGYVFWQYGSAYRAWKEPLYIVVLALVTRVAGDAGILALQALFGAATAVAVALLARAVLGDGPGVPLAGLLAAVNPFLVYYDTRFVHPLSLDSLLFVAVVGAVLAAATSARRREVLLAAAVTGLALWERATLAAAGGAAWAAALLAGRGPGRGRLARAAALWAVVSALLIAPWLVRNYVVLGRVVLTTDAAHIFWLGNNPLSNGTYSDAGGQRIFNHAPPAFRERIHGASEVAQHDAFLAAALAFVREQPEAYARLVASRLRAFAWFSPNAGVTYTSGERVWYRRLYVTLLVLGGSGLVLYWRRADPSGRRRAALVVAAVAGVALVHGLTAINLKHRVPLELVLALFGGETLARMAGATGRLWHLARA